MAIIKATFAANVFISSDLPIRESSQLSPHKHSKQLVLTSTFLHQ